MITPSPSPSPIGDLLRLQAQASAAGDPGADVMALATATPDGRPSVRHVSFRGPSADGGGVRFFTNLESRKARELALNPRAAALFLWASIGVQARLEGRAQPLDDAEADAYFAHRPRGHQLAAWASPQSRPIARADLLAAYEAQDRRHAGAAVPRPPFWGGFRLIADHVELRWRDEHRLHRRVGFTFDGRCWVSETLAP